jgi:hypothetical protein
MRGHRQGRRLEYQQLLGRALADAHERLGLGERVRLEFIGSRAVNEFEARWKDLKSRKVAWPWGEALNQRERMPACFNLAIWHGPTLCGLAIGDASPKRFVGIDLIEGRPGRSHPLKGEVILTTLTAAEFYRIQLGAPELRLFDVVPALVDLYQGFGFKLAPDLGGPHHMRRVGP